MSELKPCPFCGGNPRRTNMIINGVVQYRVACKTCDIMTSLWDTDGEAIETWNRRAQPENEPKECPAMERVEGGIPYCSDKQTACDGCKYANEPLSIAQLKQMDGEPVWCADGEGHSCYCLVNAESKDCIDSECGAWCFEFYGMTGDGENGLHNMGWLAYRRPPERSENDG